MCEIQIEQIAGDSPDAALITVFGSVDGCITTVDGADRRVVVP